MLSLLCPNVLETDSLKMIMNLLSKAKMKTIKKIITKFKSERSVKDRNENQEGPTRKMEA
jgi:hypothetical protein